jgi:ATP-binding cassette subfamily F protein uup
MDEPTNDLDVETLELLEELLGDYPGTLLLVSHDRDFLDNVVTSTLVMQDGGEGRIGEYVGGYSDWLRQSQSRMLQGAGQSLAGATGTGVANPSPPEAAAPAAREKRKLGYKETRELEQLPARIEALETRIAELTVALNEPAFYQRDSAAINAHNAALAEAQAELETAYARWEALEG